MKLESIEPAGNHRRLGLGIAAAIAALFLLAAAVAVIVATRGHEQQITSPASGKITSADVGRLRLAWRGPVGSGARVQQIVQGGGYVFAAAATRESGSVWAFPASCGTGGTTCDPLWHTAPSPSARYPSLAFADGMLFVGGDDVFAFAPSCRTDGGVCSPAWTGQVQGGVHGLLAARDVIYAGSSESYPSGRIYAFPAGCTPTGSRCAPLWVSEEIAPGRPGHQLFPLVPATVAGGLLYAAPVGGPVGNGQNLDEADLYTFPVRCRTDGEVCDRAQSTHVEGARFVSPPTFAGGVLYLGTATNDIDDSGGSLRAYDGACGVRPQCELWTATTPFALNRFQPIVAGSSVVVASYFGSAVRAYPIQCSDPCSPAWSASGDNAVATGDVVFAISYDSQFVSALPLACGSGNAACHPVWSANTQGANNLQASRSELFVGSDGAVLAFGLSPHG